MQRDDRSTEALAARRLATIEEEGKEQGPQWPQPPRFDVIAPGPLFPILNVLEPETDADMVGIIAHLLAMVGNAIGRKRHIQIGPARHYLNENVLIVGATQGGKKGTALREASRIMRHAAPEWSERNVKSGLSSGEGLIWMVRDPIERHEPVKDRDGNVSGYQTVIADPGVQDKRLLITMSEFSQLQKLMKREGNILGEVIRHAWDSEKLAIPTKNTPATATGAHVSIIGHTTPAEFRRLCQSVDELNGFLNRFMILMVKSSKRLPFGGNVDERKLAELAARVRDAIAFGEEADEPFTFADDFRAEWEVAYEWLDTDRPGRLGPILARSAPHVMRLAGIYAVLDRSPALRAAHLEAALELWHYIEASTAYVFGGNAASALAERLAAILQVHPEGMTLTNLHNATNRAIPGEDMRAALAELREMGRARCEVAETGARKRETWFPASDAKSSNYSYSSPALGDPKANGNGKSSNNSYSSTATAA